MIWDCWYGEVWKALVLAHAFWGPGRREASEEASSLAAGGDESGMMDKRRCVAPGVSNLDFWTLHKSE
jgi:hypothetical protein